MIVPGSDNFGGHRHHKGCPKMVSGYYIVGKKHHYYHLLLSTDSDLYIVLVGVVKVRNLK